MGLAAGAGFAAAAPTRADIGLVERWGYIMALKQRLPAGPTTAAAATAALACMSLSRRRASPTFTPAAAASLMARDSAAVPTPSLQAEQHTLPVINEMHHARHCNDAGNDMCSPCTRRLHGAHCTIPRGHRLPCAMPHTTQPAPEGAGEARLSGGSQAPAVHCLSRPCSLWQQQLAALLCLLDATLNCRRGVEGNCSERGKTLRLLRMQRLTAGVASVWVPEARSLGS